MTNIYVPVFTDSDGGFGPCFSSKRAAQKWASSYEDILVLKFTFVGAT